MMIDDDIKRLNDMPGELVLLQPRNCPGMAVPRAAAEVYEKPKSEKKPPKAVERFLAGGGPMTEQYKRVLRELEETYGNRTTEVICQRAGAEIGELRLLPEDEFELLLNAGIHEALGSPQIDKYDPAKGSKIGWVQIILRSKLADICRRVFGERKAEVKSAMSAAERNITNRWFVASLFNWLDRFPPHKGKAFRYWCLFQLAHDGAKPTWAQVRLAANLNTTDAASQAVYRWRKEYEKTRQGQGFLEHLKEVQTARWKPWLWDKVRTNPASYMNPDDANEESMRLAWAHMAQINSEYIHKHCEHPKTAASRYSREYATTGPHGSVVNIRILKQFYEKVRHDD